MRSAAQRFVAAPTTAAKGGPGLVQGAVRRFYLEASPEHQRPIRSRRDLRFIVTHFTGSVTGKRVVQRPGRAAAYDHGKSAPALSG